MTEVERAWFRRRFAGELVEQVYVSDQSPDADFEDATTERAEADYAAYLRELQVARAATAAHAVEETFVHPRRQKVMSLRWGLRPHDRGVRPALWPRRPDPGAH
jgi:hypothetical protein